MITFNNPHSLKESIRQTEEAIESMKGSEKDDREESASKKQANDDYTAILSSYKKKNVPKTTKKSHTLDRLKAFKEGLKEVAKPASDTIPTADTTTDAPYDYDKDDDDDPNWMNHQLHSSQTDRLQDDQARRAEVDYDVIDPRQFKRARKHENPNSDVRGRSGGAYARR